MKIICIHHGDQCLHADRQLRVCVDDQREVYLPQTECNPGFVYFIIIFLSYPHTKTECLEVYK